MSNFNKQVGKIIDKTKEKQLRGNWKKTKILTQSSFVGADIILQLLAVKGAVGLRIFYGMDDDGHMQPIFYACDENGNAIIPMTSEISAMSDSESSGGSDASIPCPPICGTGDNPQK